MNNKAPLPAKRLPVAPPRVVVEWPRGLSGVPVIFPMGRSYEENQKIRQLIEIVLGNIGISLVGLKG